MIKNEITLFFTILSLMANVAIIVMSIFFGVDRWAICLAAEINLITIGLLMNWDSTW
jgi:hypothetical protein